MSGGNIIVAGPQVALQLSRLSLGQSALWIIILKTDSWVLMTRKALSPTPSVRNLHLATHRSASAPIIPRAFACVLSLPAQSPEPEQ